MSLSANLFLSLPTSLFDACLSYLHCAELKSVFNVSKEIRKHLQNPKFWSDFKVILTIQKIKDSDLILPFPFDDDDDDANDDENDKKQSNDNKEDMIDAMSESKQNNNDIFPTPISEEISKSTDNLISSLMHGLIYHNKTTNEPNELKKSVFHKLYEIDFIKKEILIYQSGIINCKIWSELVVYFGFWKIETHLMYSHTFDYLGLFYEKGYFRKKNRKDLMDLDEKRKLNILKSFYDFSVKQCPLIKLLQNANDSICSLSIDSKYYSIPSDSRYQNKSKLINNALVPDNIDGMSMSLNSNASLNDLKIDKIQNLFENAQTRLLMTLQSLPFSRLQHIHFCGHNLFDLNNYRGLLSFAQQSNRRCLPQIKILDLESCLCFHESNWFYNVFNSNLIIKDLVMLRLFNCVWNASKTVRIPSSLEFLRITNKHSMFDNISTNANENMDDLTDYSSTTDSSDDEDDDDHDEDHYVDSESDNDDDDAKDDQKNENYGNDALQSSLNESDQISELQLKLQTIFSEFPALSANDSSKNKIKYPDWCKTIGKKKKLIHLNYCELKKQLNLKSEKKRRKYSKPKCGEHLFKLDLSNAHSLKEIVLDWQTLYLLFPLFLKSDNSQKFKEMIEFCNHELHDFAINNNDINNGNDDINDNDLDSDDLDSDDNNEKNNSNEHLLGIQSFLKKFPRKSSVEICDILNSLKRIVIIGYSLNKSRLKLFLCISKKWIISQKIEIYLPQIDPFVLNDLCKNFEFDQSNDDDCLDQKDYYDLKTHILQFHTIIDCVNASTQSNNNNHDVVAIDYDDEYGGDDSKEEQMQINNKKQMQRNNNSFKWSDWSQYLFAKRLSIRRWSQSENFKLFYKCVNWKMWWFRDFQNRSQVYKNWSFYPGKN